MNSSHFLNNRIVKNTGWLLVGKIIHMLLSFFVSLLTARYLGPDKFGLINYATAYTTFFTAFCTLGINSVIVKNFIDHPDEEGESIGTTITLRMLSSILSFFSILGIVGFVDANEPITKIVVGLYCFSLLFQVFDTFNYWFQSKLMSKYTAITTMFAYTITSIYKIILVIAGKSVLWFAIANSLDYCIVAVILFIFYKKCKGPKLSFTFRKAKELLSVSCSYILSGMMVAIYGATDKLMLKQMLTSSDVGYYALALSISMIWTFILSAIIDSMKPPIMELHNTNKTEYILMNKRLYAIVFYISFIASVGIVIIAPFFVEFIYGKAYLPAVTPLRIVVWYVAFSYLGVARDAWIVCERKQRYLKYLYLGSAVLNIVLNYILIPIWGTAGAAIASLFTQISTILVFPIFIKELRPNVKMMLDAIFLRDIFLKKC